MREIGSQKFNEEQKQNWYHVCEDWLRNFDDLFTRVITSDESSDFKYDPEMKRQWMKWKGKGRLAPRRDKCPSQKLKLP